MKHLSVIILVILSLFFNVSGQEKSEIKSEFSKKWDAMTYALSREDWKTAFDLATELRKVSVRNDKEKLEEKLRYMYLYAAAGSVLVKKMSYDQLEEVVKSEIGKEIIFPFRQVAASCQGPAFNIICADAKDKRSLMVAASNLDATTILAFEYLKFPENPRLEKYVNKYLSFGGKVTAIVPNPNRSNLVILRINAENVEVFAVNDVRSEQVATGQIQSGQLETTNSRFDKIVFNGFKNND